jgi:hypothetical protein
VVSDGRKCEISKKTKTDPKKAAQCRRYYKDCFKIDVGGKGCAGCACMNGARDKIIAQFGLTK